MPNLVLLRHGQSEWNLANRFTGWWDVRLSDKGLAEAEAAGALMKEKGLVFDIAYTSYLTRAIKTLNLALEAMDMLWLDVIKSWELNERHYGGLTGYNKKEMAEKVGEDQVFTWRRSFDIPPPPQEADSPYRIDSDIRYRNLPVDKLPETESLKDTIERCLPYFSGLITADLKAGKNVIISAHGNSLRALVKHLDGLSDDEISGVEIPTGQPLLYALSDTLSVTDKYYLKDR
ncbi:MAG: 2,3-diphosphoglycerate-dependent phosphoglycerate mutase [Pseudomonadota bacterium]